MQALERRGHAAVDAIELAAPQEALWREGKLPDALHRARAHPEWSSLNPGAHLQQLERQEQVELPALLERELQLGARRNGCRVRLHNASVELRALVAFMGLTDVLPE